MSPYMMGDVIWAMGSMSCAAVPGLLGTLAEEQSGSPTGDTLFTLNTNVGSGAGRM